MKKLLQIFILLFALEQVASAGFFSSIFNPGPKITHTPLDNEIDVRSNIVIKLTYGEDIAQSFLSSENIVLTHTATGLNIEGTVVYTEEDKTISFTPKNLLKKGQYHVKYKDILKKETAFFFIKYITCETIEFDFDVTDIKNVSISQKDIELKEATQETLSITITRDDNSTQEILNNIEWIVQDSSIASISNNTLSGLTEGTTTLHAKYKKITSAPVTVVVYKEINGHKLPPEPNETLNNSTLLGIDVNGNDVRDDVERWIYETYKDKHPVNIDIAMQAGRGYKKVLESPENALEIHALVRAPGGCQWYYMNDAKYFNEPILVSKRIITSNFINKIYFNTDERENIFLQYDNLLSGRSYTLPRSEERKSLCDFNTTKYEE